MAYLNFFHSLDPLWNWDEGGAEKSISQRFWSRSPLCLTVALCSISLFCHGEAYTSENGNSLQSLRVNEPSDRATFSSINPSTPNGISPSVPNMQQIRVSGSVKDSLGNVLRGASVFLKGKPSVGTTTDLNGLYILNVPANSTLVFRMTGYIPQEVPVGDKQTIDVVLQESKQSIDEVVVTAFGQRAKKSDLIGSVSSLSPKELRAPVSNLTTALQGKVAGVVSFQRSGEPGGDNADFFIRGVGTFGTNNRPLILVDNMEVTADDLARIPVDDIENFSILRDATASAVYGSRGANGVVLVTTKVGRDGPATINFRAEQRISTPTQTLKFADPVTWMKMYNEAVITRVNAFKLY